LSPFYLPPQEMDQLAQRDRQLALGIPADSTGKRSHEDAMDVEGGDEGGEGSAEQVERRALREFGLEEAAGYPAQEENKDEPQGKGKSACLLAVLMWATWETSYITAELYLSSILCFLASILHDHTNVSVRPCVRIYCNLTHFLSFSFSLLRRAPACQEEEDQGDDHQRGVP
jgi:hypothetical protein